MFNLWGWLGVNWINLVQVRTSIGLLKHGNVIFESINYCEIPDWLLRKTLLHGISE